MTDYPNQYKLFNAQSSKNLAVVMKIEGIDDLFSITDLYTTIRYGDSDVIYGVAGLVYGGLRRLSNVRPYMCLDQGLTLSQRIEPEQGRGNVGTVSLTLLDKDGYMSQLVSPGFLLDEPLGGKEVRLYLGYQQTSFPEDYALVFRGFITQITCPHNVVTLQLSDPTFKKRQPIFQTGATTLSGAIDASVTTIPVNQTSLFYEPILGPDAAYDSAVKPFILVDSEYMQYDPGGVGTTSFTVLSRGGSHSQGTTPAAHDVNAAVSAAVELQDNCITMALKLMLSGWAGPFETGLTLLRLTNQLAEVPYTTEYNAIVLNLDTDAVQDIGLTIGDYFTVTGAGGTNNKSGRITSFGEFSGKANRIIYTDQTFTVETPTAAVLSLRSKYDSYPVLCGLRMKPREVDVERMEYIRDIYFTQSADMRFLFQTPTAGKDVIDSQIMLPAGAYSITRFGRCSIAVTRPPLPGVTVPEINYTNVIEADKIIMQRAVNSRRFFNYIIYDYDELPNGGFTATTQVLDSKTVSTIGVVNTLPIKAPGVRTDLGGAVLASRRGRALLSRFSKAATELKLKVTWQAGSMVEVGDVVLVRDDGNLKIMNFATGSRNLGAQLFEVIDRQYDIKNGNVSLTLLGGLGFALSDRYAGISPSSKLDTGTTSQLLRVKPSYGSATLTTELAKWSKFLGLPVQVHDYYWTRSGITTLSSFSLTDPAGINVDPPLGFTPSPDDIIDIVPYDATSAETNALLKLMYVSLSPTVAVVSGISATQFTIAPADAVKFQPGISVVVHTSDYSTSSLECVVQGVVGVTVTLSTGLGFTPDSTYLVDGIGFEDGGGFYRFV